MGNIEQRHSFVNIDSATFQETLAVYTETLPTKHSELDEQRYKQIPTAVGLTKSSGNAHLTKAEVETLVDWKLSHGTFRPTLKRLVASNSGSDVQSATTSGFATFAGSDKDVKAAVTTLSKLKGVGPATASLMLSVFNPDMAPFFSDELFRWAFWEDCVGKGWDRKIGYSVKEYLELYDRVQEFKSRIKAESGTEVGAVDVEKVAYVLGKSNRSPTAGSTINAVKPPVVKNTKRKATTDAEVAPENLPQNIEKARPSKPSKKVKHLADDSSVPREAPVRRSQKTKR